MVLSSIREDEEIIKQLEDMDENFSAIKCTLRELRLKIGRIAEKHRDIAEDCKPWIKFFEIEPREEFSPFSELQLNSLRFKEAAHSPNNLTYSSPRNPFIEAESSELLNKSMFKALRTNMTTLSSTSYLHVDSNTENPKNIQSDSEDTVQDIVPFNRELLPEIFQNEDELVEIYAFIQRRRSVSLECLLENFKQIPPEKLEILISLLCRKRFVQQSGSKITVDK